MARSIDFERSYALQVAEFDAYPTDQPAPTQGGTEEIQGTGVTYSIMKAFRIGGMMFSGNAFALERSHPTPR